MSSAFTAAVLIAGVTLSGALLAAVIGALSLAAFALYITWWRSRLPHLARAQANPVLEPNPANWWESEAVFNPAAFVERGRVHLLYRALGRDGISRIGYASSRDGIHFDERLPFPVFTPTRGFGIPSRNRTYGPLSYDTFTYASGGGWGGSEDPRIVNIGGELMMTFVAFDGWGFVRMALTTLSLDHFRKKEWEWTPSVLLSPPNQIHKNWIIFPTKIKRKFAIIHSISPKIEITYRDSLDGFGTTQPYIESSVGPRIGGREGHWDNHVRGAGTPPIKTKHGWLLFYHATDEHDPGKYKVGAMLLDLKDPTKVLFRSNEPILAPDAWYENDGKPGVVYASGAVVFKGNLLVYYGGGDKRIAMAYAPLETFVEQLARGENAILTHAKV